MNWEKVRRERQARHQERTERPSNRPFCIICGDSFLTLAESWTDAEGQVLGYCRGCSTEPRSEARAIAQQQRNETVTYHREVRDKARERQKLLSSYVEKYELECLGCGARKAEWARAGVHSSGRRLALCKSCSTKFRRKKEAERTKKRVK